MRWVLGALLVTAAWAGCLGTQTDDGTAPDDGEDPAATPGGCNRDSAVGTVRPGEPLVLDAEAEAPQASASISGESVGTGELNLTLTRDGETVWSDTDGGPGSVEVDSFSTSISPVDAGAYTLTLSSETAVRNVTAELAIAWGEGSC